MKQLWAVVFSLLAGLFVFAGVVFAHEGDIDLTNANVSCKGISLWRDSQYRVTGRCDGLVYPYQTTYDHYILWAKTDPRGDVVRLGSVNDGYFDGNVQDPFTDLYITAETDELPHRPGNIQVVSGSVTPFSFDKSQVTATPAPSGAPAETTAPAKATSGSTVGQVVGRIVTSLLIIILVIVGIAIVASLIFRRRGSVSA